MDDSRWFIGNFKNQYLSVAYYLYDEDELLVVYSFAQHGGSCGYLI